MMNAAERLRPKGEHLVSFAIGSRHNGRDGGIMTVQEFLNEIDGIIQTPPGTTKMSDEIANLPGWDSMAILMFLSMIDEQLNMTLDIPSLASCKTVSDLARLCEIKTSQI